MAQIVNFDLSLTYQQRCKKITQAGFALWDSLACCERTGSLDSAINLNSEVANPIDEWLVAYPSIDLIACNGGKSRQCLRRHIERNLPKSIEIIQLPSTSPANASMPFSEKLHVWQAALSR